jgi:hypothetical protein
LGNLVDSAREFWYAYVIRFNREHQRRAKEALVRWRDALAALAGRLVAGVAPWNARGWIGWVAACCGLVAVGAGAAAVLIAGLRRAARRAPAARRRAARSSEVRFYRDFLKIAARAGLRKGECETPLEFAGAVGRLGPEAGRLARELTALFYEVRFGGRHLGTEAIRTAEAELGRFKRLARGLSERPP